MGNPKISLADMARTFRSVRKRVFEEATLPFDGSTSGHRFNQQKFRACVQSICNASSLPKYGHGDSCPTSEHFTRGIWHQLWTKIRYAGFKAETASTEIRDIECYFDDYRRFGSGDWDIQANGHEMIQGGPMVHAFLNRTGPFRGKNTVRNVAKLERTIRLARSLAKHIDDGNSAISFVLRGSQPDDVWAVHRKLTKDTDSLAALTALHFMMDIGLQVVKPDIVLTRLMIHWGWLQSHFDDVPDDISEADIRGKGPAYGTRYRYDKPFMYRRVIDLSLEIVRQISCEDLQADIGWVTDNPVREFDLFLVKFGQLPEPEIGIVRTLFAQASHGSSCPTTTQIVNP
jgi:hypothetical protein